ncbi:hypothetical protein IHV10_20010 [Fictibacillus sp. 5RED26]|uniref:hypothetical protein n=1 Tax=Fictibacillus sp. 5RED26 TaxID=2745876 RepID=UPI0018CE9E80|nr:hypothetical protein [Fictibacillus sp. 5RED26]MBH0158671.1 hypothetical protein [Fictibacillus sp. 5RED26]
MVLESVLFKLYPKYHDYRKLVDQQVSNHSVAEKIAIKSVKDFQLDYGINNIYSFSVVEEDNNKKNLLTEITDYNEENQVYTAFTEGIGNIFLIDEYEKKNMLKDAYFQNKMNNGDLSLPIKATDVKQNVPDFLYVIDNRNYMISLQSRFSIETEEGKRKEVEQLYKYLFKNLGKSIDIDPDFDKSGCYEKRCKLVYFRLNLDSLYIVIEHNNKNVYHTFKNIRDIAHTVTYGGEALKFWLYMGDRNYRFYLHHPDSLDVQIDSAIYSLLKPIKFV